MGDTIEHVIVLMFENRSFDHILGCYQSLRAGVDGVDTKNLRQVPSMDQGVTFRQAVSHARTMNPGPGHESRNVQAQLHLPPQEQNQGFVIDYQLSNHIVTSAQTQEVMNYYDHGDLPAMHALADNFTICDHWFASVAL
jgi:phospholipase C